MSIWIDFLLIGIVAYICGLQNASFVIVLVYIAGIVFINWIIEKWSRNATTTVYTFLKRKEKKNIKDKNGRRK
jgi:hypothetical protein